MFFWRRVAPQIPEDGLKPTATPGYTRNFRDLNDMVSQGKSFSGYERNALFLNRKGNGFAEVGGLLGVDFDDDARAVAVVDWDRDGDLDLWVTNRTAPRVRLLRNNQPSANSFRGDPTDRQRQDDQPGCHRCTAHPVEIVGATDQTDPDGSRRRRIPGSIECLDSFWFGAGDRRSESQRHVAGRWHRNFHPVSKPVRVIRSRKMKGGPASHLWRHPRLCRRSPRRPGKNPPIRAWVVFGSPIRCLFRS